MADDRERIVMLFSIVERGSGADLIRFLKEHSVRCHLEFTGMGTATHEMLDILGLDSGKKDVILSFGPKPLIAAAMDAMDEIDWPSRKGRGLMMRLSAAAVNRLFAAVLTRDMEKEMITEMENEKKNEFGHSLLLIAVRQGYTEPLMLTARQAGAAGGTVIRSRMIGTDIYEEMGILMDAEREIIAILAPDSRRNEILDAVNRDFGLRTPAQGILCALPVDRAVKI